MLIHWAEAYILYRKTDALVVASKETELEVNVEKLSNCSCLEITMQDEVTVQRLIKVPLKGWKISNIWEQT